jgi:cysteinyl-tRNA synthetase
LDVADMMYANAKIDPDLLFIYKNFLTAMDNDFNTANAITALQDLTKKANQMMRSKTEYELLLSVLKVYDDIFQVLGLKIDVSPLSKEDKEVYNNWENARKEKDFEGADKYREILQEKGII